MAHRRRASTARSLPRVLVVPSSYFAATRTIGGGERYAHEYARALSRLTPTTLALFDTTPASRMEGQLEIRTFEVREVSDRLLFPITLRALRELAAFDVLHLMVFPTPLTDLLILLGRLRGQRIVLTDVGGGKPSPSTYLQRIHPRLSLNRLAHGLALLSSHSAGQFDGWPQPRTLLYGGADADPVDARAEEVGTDEPYALFVGRLLPHKGVLEVIEALDATTPLRIVGRPYDQAYVEKLREAARGKNVRLMTEVDDAELSRQYRGARVVLQPSVPVRGGANDTSELLGLVAIEGMAYGKPVVVTRAGSLPELVVDGATGFVVPPGDGAALFDRISRLMKDPALAARMGEAARASVRERFSWDRVAATGLEFYGEIDGRKREALK